jgi:hypothetical protein
MSHLQPLNYPFLQSCTFPKTQLSRTFVLILSTSLAPGVQQEFVQTLIFEC